MISLKFEPKAQVDFSSKKADQPQQTPQPHIETDFKGLSSNMSLSFDKMSKAIYAMGWVVLAAGSHACGSLFHSVITGSSNYLITNSESVSASILTSGLEVTSKLVGTVGVIASFALTSYCIYNAVNEVYSSLEPKAPQAS